ncbi:MAG: Rpn family recombination-promoting nuclease/putative transposase, partial [Treponema sp.]|nr:Rpn family recombination-promoting nuclease/putative transposase [Treponema sp.]
MGLERENKYIILRYIPKAITATFCPPRHGKLAACGCTGENRRVYRPLPRKNLYLNHDLSFSGDVMTTERLNPLNDYLFRKVMGEKGDEEQLLSFLNAVLKREGKNKLVSIEIIENRNLTAEIIGDKTSILDVRSKTGDGTRINVEVQLRNLGNMDKRSLFYWSREYSKGLEAGREYQELPAVIAVNIIDFELMPDTDYHSSFHLWEDTRKGVMLTDALEIHFVEMAKFRKVKEKDIKNDALQRWLAYLDRESSEGLVEEVMRMDRGIQRA